MYSYRLGFVIAAAALLLGITGCGKEIHSVQGRITVDGKPVSKATVRFIPEAQSSPRLAFGMTDDDGRYVLATFGKGNDGVLPGSYRVTVTNSENTIAPPGPPSGDKESNARAMQEYRRHWEEFKKQPAVPGRLAVVYAEIETTPLRWKVPQDGEVANFELPSDQAAQPAAN